MRIALFASPGMPSAKVVKAYEEALSPVVDRVCWISIPGFSRVFKAEAQRNREKTKGPNAGRILPRTLQKYAHGIKATSVIFIGYSAGCWYWRDGLSKHAADRADIDAVIMLDGLHGKKSQLKGTVEYLREGGDMLVAHTSVHTYGYPSTTETVATLRKLIDAADILHRVPKPGETEAQQHGRVLTTWGPLVSGRWATAREDSPCHPANDPPEPEPVEQPRPRVTQPGEKGDDVRAWQRWLIAHGFELPRFGADGGHGGETTGATNAWRKSEGIAEVHPIIFKQAASYTPGRRLGRPKWIPIHTAEATEHSKTPENLQSWALGRIGVSWHYAVGAKTIRQSVRERDTAWTAGTSANPLSIQIELAGYASQTAAQWDDQYSTSQLELTARLVAGICHRHDIPANWVGPDEMERGIPGICGHDDITMGIGEGETNHMDPGRNYPRDLLIERVRYHLAAGSWIAEVAA